LPPIGASPASSAVRRRLSCREAAVSIDWPADVTWLAHALPIPGLDRPVAPRVHTEAVFHASTFETDRPIRHGFTEASPL